MTDDELIAGQVRRIAELEERLNEYRDAMDRIYLQLYAIGAPLNDNKEGYTRVQLETFFNIARHVIQEHENHD